MAELQAIDRFEVIEPLGSGAFATVWLVRDPVLELRFAIKVLADNWSRNPLLRERFIDEARTLAQSTSARIIRVHNVGELDDGRPYFVMTWADRGTLEQRIVDRVAAGSSFSVLEASAIASEIALAIADVHDSGRIHRDIKPGNILITSTTSRSAVAIPGLAADERLLLGDFGLARSLDESAITFVSGSPAYVAPEQAGGLTQLTENVDLFPIGIIAAELVTGTRAAFRASMAEAAAGRIDIAAHFADVGCSPPPAFVSLVQQLLDPDPARRPGSALEVATAFAAIAAQGPGPAAVPAGPAPAGVPATPPVVSPGAGPRSDGPVTAAPSGIGPEMDATQVVAPPVDAPGNRGSSGRPPWWALAIPALAVTGAIVIGAAIVAGGGDPDSEPVTAAGSSASGDATATTIAGGDPSGTETTDSGDDSGGVTLDGSETASTPSGRMATFPLPETAVMLEAGSEGSVSVIAAPIEEVTEFYFQQDHEGWEAESPTTNLSTEVRFRMVSSDRSAEVVVTPTAQDVGSGVVEIAVTYQER